MDRLKQLKEQRRLKELEQQQQQEQQQKLVEQEEAKLAANPELAVLSNEQRAKFEYFQQLPNDPVILFQELISYVNPQEVLHTSDDVVKQAALEDGQKEINYIQTVDDKRTLRISKLPKDTLADQLKEFISKSQFEFESIKLAPAGRDVFAFVVFKDEVTAARALEKLQGQSFGSQKIQVDFKVTYKGKTK